MRKLATITLAVLLVGLFAAVVYAAVDAGDNSSVGTTDTSPTTETTGTTTTDDQPAHRHRHHGHRGHRHRHHVQRHVATPVGGVDVSGPCDEAEHANDPRCTGVQPRVEDDNVRGDDRGEVERHDLNDDRGGVDDRFGVDDRGDDHGGDDLQQEDDHSGPGHGGGGDDDNSGPGGGEDD